MGESCVSDSFSRLGYDFLWVDFEHSYLSYKDILNHIAISQSNGTSVIVRVPEDDLTATKKILDMGADGIIFPMVKSVEDIKKLISYTLYPPMGNRGFGPMGAINYGVCDAKEYVKTSNKDICRFIQIECKDVVDNLEEIMDIEEIDGYIFGPNDLSGSVGDFLNVFEEKNIEIMETAIKKLQSRGKYIGLATSDIRPEVISFWSEMGIDMMCCGCDTGYLLTGAVTAINNIKASHMKG